MVKLAGDAEREKFAAGITDNDTVVEFDSIPEVPVTVTGKVPVAAPEDAVSVNTVVVVAGFGLNETVTPLGKPDAVKVTLPLKPFCGFTVIVLEAEFP